MSATVPRSVRVRACAKINLTLRVLGIRPDGYHELRTTFQSLSLHDTLTFTVDRGPFSLTSQEPGCPTDSSNLVWKAAQRLWDAAGRRGQLRGTRVHITKRIPVQAGLGGGSSDAAAALRALSMLWNVKIPRERIDEIARDLGADVVFFLEGGTVLGVERGDLLFPLQDEPPSWVVIARPNFGVSTKDAYAWWDESWRRDAKSARASASPRAEWVNDLQAPVTARHPSIARLVGHLRRHGARFAAMSGSGSAVFGLFDDRSTARHAAAALPGAGVQTWLTRTTNRREYLRLSAPSPGR
jgi:4-diphosphocytidyl-2-C-methyl-D-erythritol kinase